MFSEEPAETEEFHEVVEGAREEGRAKLVQGYGHRARSADA